MPGLFSEKSGFTKVFTYWMIAVLFLSIFMRISLMSRSFDTLELGHTLMYPPELSLKELLGTQFARSKMFFNAAIIKIFSGFIENKKILLRTPSFIFSLGLFLFTYFAVARLLNREIASISVILMAVSPQILYRSVDYQDYMILIFFSFMSVYLMWALFSRHTGWVYLILFVFTLSINLINSIKAVFLFPVFILFPVAMLILPHYRTRYFQFNKKLVLLKMFICIACSVALLILFYNYQSVNLIEMFLEKISEGKVSVDFMNYRNPNDESFNIPLSKGFELVSVYDLVKMMSPQNTFLFYLYLFFASSGLIILFRNKKTVFLLFAVTLLSTILVAQLGFYVYSPPRYLNSLICFYLVLCATGISGILSVLCTMALQRLHGTHLFTQKIILISAVILLIDPMILVDRNYALLAINKVDYSTIVDFLKKEIRSNDIVLNVSANMTSQLPDLLHEHPSRILGKKIALIHGTDLLPGKKGPLSIYFISKLNFKEIKIGPDYMDYFPVGFKPRLELESGRLKLWKESILFDPTGNIGLERFDTLYWDIIFGNYYFMHSDLKKSLDYYRNAVKYGKFLDRIYNNIGIIFYHLNDAQKSFEYFSKSVDACNEYIPDEKILRNNPIFEYPHFNIANMLIGLGKSTEIQQQGLDYIEAVADKNPYMRKYYNNFKEKIQNSRLINGRWDIAIQPFQTSNFVTKDLCRGKYSPQSTNSEVS